MNVREKLIEILKTKYDHFCDQCGINKDSKYTENLVSYLIANGVTVQEWISVAEPPKEYRDKYGELIPFLVCVEGTDYPFRAMYDGKTWGDGIFAIPVKWWMHLPAPPKKMDEKED